MHTLIHMHTCWHKIASIYMCVCICVEGVLLVPHSYTVMYTPNLPTLLNIKITCGNLNIYIYLLMEK